MIGVVPRRKVLWRIVPPVWIAFFLLCFRAANAAIPADILARTKAATAYIATEEGSGSAFCINPGGIFVTNAHVVEGVDPGGTVTLVLRPNDTDQEIVKGTVLYTDKIEDLAFVQATGVKKMPQELTLGDDASLQETMEVAAFGYPFGSMLAFGAKYPSITVSTGHITALRRQNGVLQKLQLDASVNPGNSGGPIIDAQGRVVGIVVSGFPGSGVNFAIPISHLLPFQTKTEIALEPQHLFPGHQHDVQAVRVCVLNLNKSLPVTNVDIDVNAMTSDHRVFPAKTLGGGVYEAQVIPIPVGNDAARNVHYKITARDGIDVLAVKAESIPVRAPSPAMIGSRDGFPVKRAEKEFIEILPRLKKIGKSVDGDVKKFLQLAAPYGSLYLEVERAQSPEEAKLLKEMYFVFASASCGINPAESREAWKAETQAPNAKTSKQLLIAALPRIKTLLAKLDSAPEIRLLAQEELPKRTRLNNLFTYAKDFVDQKPSEIMGFIPSGHSTRFKTRSPFLDRIHVSENDYDEIERQFQDLNVLAIDRTRSRGTEVIQRGLITAQVGLLFQDANMQPPEVGDAQPNGRTYTVVEPIEPRVFYYETE